ncbi:sugar ABC transporter ATP-binding protein [Mesorhizobium mediterraneum]|uniref:D-xylose ABC transporter ATP-binding protein n=1 Tax=Mesorhizobium mediterraneum TaxID=43617 RepID=A0AB36RH07_9HYPH|nr:sugar ABC transporter ATP-binding protein [Mesorhizobium mediterraneum]PAQ04153.1 D-xylose ABC transporter ATP-binding protein [Mesorhizobium mediterraneum]RWN39350.1 MAG: sugar ABC transporter ATP-binding protein [Mesorhizobium sp.]WIW56504.1 sugar ABC transporter ATP-binding protein [Mesorhizobium mediterraneum]
MSPAEAAAPSLSPALLAVEGVTKRFAGVTALSDVSPEVRPGEILGLLGENGAGKSTLLKILSGVMPPTSGRIVFDGVEFAPHNPQDAKRLGIVTIYQELSLIPTLTVAENIFIGRAPLGPLGLVSWRKMEEASRGIIARVGLDLDPATPVSALSVAEQQLVEIARALSLKSRLIIMDEPTSALTETEVQKLMSIMGRLRKDGVAIMFVTHRLEEASAICDRMTVLRDGRLAGHLDREGGPIKLPKIIEKMVGRAASELYARPTLRDVAGDVRLSVRGLRTVRDPQAPHAIVLEGVDLDLKAGEILGVAGLVGSGRTELARAIFGADRIAAGTITLDGKPIAPETPADAIALGIGLVPEDRKHQAIFAALGILTNFSIAALGRYSNAAGFMTERREREALASYRKTLSIRMASPEQPIEGLSGGNQQKVILARWLARDPKVLIVDEPTRGVDVGAKAEVHQILVQLAARGIAIMMISSELPEVLAVSDRIVTMRRGRITGEMPGIEATEEKLMELMALDQKQEATQ